MLDKELVLYHVEKISRYYGWGHLSEKEYWDLDSAKETVRDCQKRWPEEPFRIVKAVTSHTVVAAFYPEDYPEKEESESEEMYIVKPGTCGGYCEYTKLVKV